MTTFVEWYMAMPDDNPEDGKEKKMDSIETIQKKHREGVEYVETALAVEAIEKAREEERRETINGIIGYCHEAGHCDVKNALEEYLEKLDAIAEGGEDVVLDRD